MAVESNTSSPIESTGPAPVSNTLPTVDPFLSKKFRFYSFLSMVLLVFVHGYNLADKYLQPFTIVHEKLTFTTFTEYFLANGLFRFRIPMLFIISGYLFSLRDAVPYPQRIRKRLRTLMLPYIIWSVLGLLVTLAFEQQSLLRSAVIVTNLQPFGGTLVGSYTIQQWIIRLFLAPVPFQLWFIRSLFIYNLAYPLIKYAVVRYPAIILTIFGIIWTISLPMGLVESEGLMFFTLGVFMAQKGFNPQVPPRWVKLSLIAPAWISLVLLKTVLAFHDTLFGVSIPPFLYFMYKAAVLLGLVTMWYGCDPLVRFMMEKRWFVWIAPFSFIIYALHVPIINYLIVLLAGLDHGWFGFRLTGFILLPLWTIGFSILLGATLRRVAPGVYSLLTGGRGAI